MEIKDIIYRLGEEIPFTKVFEKVSNGKSVYVFCPSRPKMKDAMDAIESKMNGNMLVNYSSARINYKKGSVSFLVVPELVEHRLNKLLGFEIDHFCVIGGCFEN